MIYLELFYVFFLIGLFTFGGGYAMIPLIESEVVSRGWLSEAEFYNMIAISESTPGPIAVNMATFVGRLHGGVFGAFCATFGVVLPSFIIILLIASVLTKIIEKPVVKAILHGFQGIVIGLIIATGVYFLYQNLLLDGGNSYSLDISAIVIFCIVFFTAFLYKKIKKKAISPYIILLMGAALGAIFFFI